ncbi:hypothetical protein JW887_02060 [Candidatus Dojkabacteria bacterium]|nr:hypothetical protein [Candidatus Dojkabacteria bacterium]
MIHTKEEITKITNTNTKTRKSVLDQRTANKNSKQEIETQLDLGIKYKGNPLIDRFKNDARKKLRILELFIYWRSAILWFLFFLNTVAPYFLYTKFAEKLSKLDYKFPLFYYLPVKKDRLITKEDLLFFLITFAIVQLVGVALGSKVYFKSKDISYLLIITQILSSIFVYLGLYKSLLMIF